MDTKKQRQRRRDDARLTESGNTRSEQLNTRGTYRVANQQSLACLSGAERQRPACLQKPFVLLRHVAQKTKLWKTYVSITPEDLSEALGGISQNPVDLRRALDHLRKALEDL